MTFFSSFSSDFKRNYVFLDPSKYQGPGISAVVSNEMGLATPPSKLPALALFL